MRVEAAVFDQPLLDMRELVDGVGRCRSGLLTVTTFARVHIPIGFPSDAVERGPAMTADDGGSTHRADDHE